MVTIDGTNTKDWGFRVSRIIGDLDILKRKVQDRFGWFDSDGDQSYTLAEDIVFQGRTIILHGHMVQTRDNFNTALETFKTALNATGLRALVTPYSTVTRNVYVKGGIRVGRLNRWAENTVYANITVSFFEPEPDDSPLGGDAMPTPEPLPGGEVQPGDSKYRMDDRGLKYNWGIRVMKFTGNFDQSKQKVFPAFNHPFTNGVPYYQDANDLFYESRQANFKLYMKADSLADLAESLRLFKSHLFATGLREFKLPYYDLTFRAYSIAGGRVTMLTRSTEAKAVAEINLKLKIPQWT